MLSCPACKGAMNPVKYPDLTLDLCADCGGVFLDAGELNELVVTSGGDIEDLSRPGLAGEATTRMCPRCDDQPMTRARILDVVDPEVETCPVCRGWFLDAGEVGLANEVLRRYNRTGSADEEFRGRIDGHLVRLDRMIGADVFPLTSFGLFEHSASYALLTVSVYFREPLGLDLHVLAEDWTHWLAKLTHRFKGTDKKTGDPALDRRILVNDANEAGLAALRTPAVATFLREDLPKARMLGKRLRWAIRDDRVLGWSVPVAVDARYDPELDPDGCVAVLRKLAARLETAAGSA